MLEILTFVFFVELGYMPQSQVYTYTEQQEIIDSSKQLYTELGIRMYLWDTFYVGGAVKTHMWIAGFGNFFPHKTDYLFEFGVIWGVLEIGFRHWCKHPVVPYLHQMGNFDTVDEVHETIFIRMEGKISGKK